MHRSLEGRLLQELKKVAQLRLPIEAVGIILPDDRVVELPNRYNKATEGFTFNKGDLVVAFSQAHVALNDDMAKMTTLWHSHPGGGVGPSRVDMTHKLPLMSHLVIALQGDEVIPSWY